jgi:hypothetical protein
MGDEAEQEILRAAEARAQGILGDLALKVDLLERRLIELNERATLSAIKETVLTEVCWYARRAHQPALDAVMNVVLAMDLPARWWHGYKGASLGEWWAMFNRPVARFREEHAIGE